MSTDIRSSRSGPGPLRILFVLGAAAVGIALIVSAISPQFVDEPEDPAVGAQLLPDLVAAPLIELTAGRSPEGREFLYFSGEIANLGPGEFQLRAIRASPTTDTWRVRQRIQHATSGYTRVDVPTTMEFAGDSHDHWHVYRVARYRLLATGREVAEDAKVGFCFFDHLRFAPDLPNVAEDPVFEKDTCDGRDVTAFNSGLSVGWSDRYVWTLLGQHIEITDVEPGRYLLEMAADPEGWFVEARTDNNRAWVEIQLGRTEDNLPTVTVLSSGTDD
jgi:hypothetical protein